MNPEDAIVWICVVVFAITSVITLLYLLGWERIPKEHGRYLFKILIVEIVAGAVGVFTYRIQTFRKDERLHPPIYDESKSLFLFAQNVSRANHLVELLVDTKSDFSSRKQVNLLPRTPQVVSFYGRKYRLMFTRSGKIDPDPQQQQSRDKDFVFLSVERLD
jgi:hypothetical protein